MPKESPEVADAIKRPYLLVIHIPVFVDKAGQRWVDPLWHKDLIRHLDYLKAFVMACPHVYAEPPAGSLPLAGYPITYVELPRQGGRIRNLASVPATAWGLWKAIAGVDVVHSGIGNWNPLSLGNLTFAISELQRKFRLIIVESATWRTLPGGGESLLRRCDAALSEWVNRACVSSADLAVFTHAEYKRTLMPQHPERGHVIHASWIDEGNILEQAAAERLWQQKVNGPVRYLFAGRLAASKGVRHLLDALLKVTDLDLCVDIMGEGELAQQCRDFSAQSNSGKLKVQWLRPVEYGEPFLTVLQGYHAALVPSLGDEQPRIVYDAYSQAVPVLASSTFGLQDCVIEGKTGRFFPPGDVERLAQTLRWGVENRQQLQTMGLDSLARAKALTHREMHQKRLRLLQTSLEQYGFSSH